MNDIEALQKTLLEVLRNTLESTRDLFRLREEIYQDAFEGRQFNLLYFAMLVLACLIALSGLLLNSPAVIIGAMLISPLMGPILSCGLALTLADWDLGRKAGKNAVLSVVEVIVIAAIATSLSPLKDATPEILARTSPNLVDLLIAFFSGLAGTLALASKKGGLTILPGVAIATAVMPPLATVGYGVSTRQWNVAGGAFMLFFTNFTAIVISADLVFLLIGFRPQQVQVIREHSILVKWRITIASVVLLALSIPLLRTLLSAARQARVRREVESVLHEKFDHPGKSRLASLDVKAAGRPFLVDGVVQTENFIESHQINAAEVALTDRLKGPVRLVIEQIQLAHEVPAPVITEGRDFVGGGVVRPGVGPGVPESVSETLLRIQDKAQTSLRSLMEPIGVSQLQVEGLGAKPGGTLRLEVSAVENEVTEDRAWKVAGAALGKELETHVEIAAVVGLDGVEAHEARFAKDSFQLSSSEWRRVTRYLARWRTEPAVGVILIVPQSIKADLRDHRILFLRQRLRVQKIVTSSAENPIQENAILLRPAQAVSAGYDTDAPKTE